MSPPEDRARQEHVMTIPTAADLIRKITDLDLRPEALQALWDGDTEGWGLRFEVVHRAWPSPSAELTSTTLEFFRFGGDVRLFSGEVPPWPEARVATELGVALANHYGVPFFFPSSQEPDDNCPAWWEQDRAVRCADCDKLILPRNGAPPSEEVCYPCELARQVREKIRRDDPVSGGVTILFGKGDAFKRHASSTDPRS